MVRNGSPPSYLGRAYQKLYEVLCGHHPRPRPWHFQWLDTYYLRCHLRNLLPTLKGHVLDVGCGDKPYHGWFSQGVRHTGIDVSFSPAVDLVVAPNEPWPFPENHFDALLASQVLEHVENLHLILAEMERVLKQGGMAVLSFPFIYNEHGVPSDYRRFSVYGAERLFPKFEIVRLEKEGGVGSTLAILFLNWIETSLNCTFATRLLKSMLLPAWIFLSLIVNLFGLLVDKLDHTGGFYNNILLVVRKPL